MPYIAETTIRELNDKLDAVAVVNDYVRLEKRGGRYWGLCPFHNEKTGSFTVNPDMKWYHCFGCGKSGSVIDFVMEMDKLTFPEAVEQLARRTGIDLVYESTGGGGSAEGGRDKDQLFELYRRVAVSFHHYLLEKGEGSAAKSYILSRGINGEMIDRFRLGYAPANRAWLHRFLSEKGYSAEFLASTGLFSQNYPRSAFFSDRLMFPIADRQGRTVAFGGRILSGDGPKYLNSGESALYKKRDTLYAIDLALPEIRKTAAVYIAEGYLDVVALHQAGVTNAVAPLGTAFTDEQARLLRRWAERAYLIFDSDEAGQNAALKGIMTCRKNGLESFVVTPQVEGPPESRADSPAPKDPADILQNFGPEALHKSVKCFINDFEYLIGRSKSLFDLSDSQGKSRAAAFLFPYLRLVDSEVSRDSYLGVIADELGADRQAVASDFSRFGRAAVSGQGGSRAANPVAPAVRRTVSLNDELFLLIAVLVNHDLYPRLRSALAIEDFDDPAARELFIALEEWYRNDMPGMDDLKARIGDEALRNFVIQQGVSEAFSMNPDKLVGDGIRKIRQKRLERRLARIVAELRITKYGQHHTGPGGTALEDLLSEKVHLDAELRLLKEAN